MPAITQARPPGFGLETVTAHASPAFWFSETQRLRTGTRRLGRLRWASLFDDARRCDRPSDAVTALPESQVARAVFIFIVVSFHDVISARAVHQRGLLGLDIIVTETGGGARLLSLTMPVSHGNRGRGPDSVNLIMRPFRGRRARPSDRPESVCVELAALYAITARQLQSINQSVGWSALTIGPAALFWSQPETSSLRNHLL